MNDQLGTKRLRKQADALDRINLAQIGAARAGVELRKAIVAADKAGVPVMDVAAAAGLSRARIYQILKEEGPTS